MVSLDVFKAREIIAAEEAAMGGDGKIRPYTTPNVSLCISAGGLDQGDRKTRSDQITGSIPSDL